jgi:ubiquinone/menaquinone biosynthesis C-methylase UbiE
MSFVEKILYRLAKNWKSPVADRIASFGAEPGTEKYELAYAQKQYDRKVTLGLGFAVSGSDVLEIGCGHGGISCFMATTGARSVVGIDINKINLGYAEKFLSALEERSSRIKLPIEFLEMRADRLELNEDSFDYVLADNVFEHFDDPEAVMKEACRVLRPGGRLMIPTFSSILSKYGLHLKHGLKMPWANIIFSESTIVAVMIQLAKENPNLLEIYPGLKGNPRSVKELRRYEDLNEITYGRFKEMARRQGFAIEWFRPQCTLIGRVIQRMPGFDFLADSRLIDVFSTGAGACLRKRID